MGRSQQAAELLRVSAKAIVRLTHGGKLLIDVNLVVCAKLLTVAVLLDCQHLSVDTFAKLVVLNPQADGGIDVAASVQHTIVRQDGAHHLVHQLRLVRAVGANEHDIRSIARGVHALTAVTQAELETLGVVDAILVLQHLDGSFTELLDDAGMLSFVQQECGLILFVLFRSGVIESTLFEQGWV